MRKWLMASALVLLASLPCCAQYVQGAGVNAAPDTVFAVNGTWSPTASYSFTFPKPTTAPCTLMVSMRQSGLVISDTQKNNFALASNNLGRYGELWYSTSCASAADTVTVACPGGTPCWAQFTISEYSGVWVPDQVSAELQDVTGTTGYTQNVTPTQDGELIVGIGNNHTTNTPSITGMNGFAVRAVANQFIADFLQPKAAPIASAVTYASSVLWCQTTISFKPLVPPPPPPPPQPNSVTVSAKLLWCALCDGTDNVPATGNLVISQTNGAQSSAVIFADGTVTVKETVDISQDPIEIILQLTDANGVAQAGAQLKLAFPKFELSSAAFTIKTVSLGTVRIAHTTDADGNPAARIVDWSNFAIGR